MSDETEAGVAPDAETTIAPPIDYPPTPAAWSSESLDLLGEVERRTWSDAWLRAASIAAASLVVAFAICVIGVAIMLASEGKLLKHPEAPAVSSAPAALPVADPPSSALKTADPQPSSAPAPAPVATDPHDDEFVALAISPLSVALNDPTHAAAWGTSGTQQEANDIALRICAKATGHTDCTPVNAGMFHGCVSFAIYGQKWAAGSGHSQAEAVKDATSNLRVAGGASVAVECSTPPGGNDKPNQEIN